MNDPPEEFGPTSDSPAQQAPLASALPYALAVPSKPPRVWTVFVLYVLCTTVGLGVGVGAFSVGMLIEQGPGAFRDPSQIESGPMPLLAFGLMFVALELVLFVGVIAAALAMGMTLVEWAILLVCVTAVLTAEMFNSALESLARALDKSSNPHIRDALDIASAAVLVCAVGAAVVGALIFLRKLGTARILTR